MNYTKTVLALALAITQAPAFAQLKAPKTTPPAAAAPAAAPASAAGGPTNPAHAEKEAAAQLAALAWLTLLDAKDWGRAWEGASAMFRASVPIAAWMDGIPKVRDPLGKLSNREPIASMYRDTLEGRPRGDYVTVSFDSRFSDKDEVEEIVTLVREPDGKWRVTGYQTR